MKNMKYILGGLIALSFTSTYAQFVGIDQLAVKDKSTIKLLDNAIRSKNSSFIDQWISEKGFTFPYDGKGYCLSGFAFEKTDYKILPNTAYASDLYNYSNAILFPTSCDTVGVSGFSPSGDAFVLDSTVKLVPEMFVINHNNKSDAEHEAFSKKYLLKLIDGLKDNQWEILPHLVKDSNVDFEVRKQALLKFQSLYAKKDTVSNDLQKAIVKDMEKIVQTKQPYVVKDYVSDSILDPFYYMYAQITHSILKESEHVARWNDFKEKKTPTLSKDWFLGKDNQSLSAKDFYIKGSQQKQSMISVIKIMQNKELLDMIKKQPGFNINKQDVLGNTLLHNIFLRDSYLLGGNIVAANFIRALLEGGANPMLMNKDNQSAFETFESRLSSASYKEIDEAFRLKEYKY